MTGKATAGRDLGELSLTELRARRGELMSEELTLASWRRLVQSWLDLLLAERLAAVDPAVAAPDDVSCCPDLAELWRVCTPASPRDQGRLLERLADAERAIGAHRAELHRQIDAATAELVTRYREDPSQCLVALPLASGRASA